MITHSVKLEIVENGTAVPVTGKLTRCEDLGVQGDDAALVSGKFELVLEDGETSIVVRGARSEFSRILRFMDE